MLAGVEVFQGEVSLYRFITYNENYHPSIDFHALLSHIYLLEEIWSADLAGLEQSALHESCVTWWVALLLSTATDALY